MSRRYYAYMLRFWRDSGGSDFHPPPWRFCLEDPHTRVRRGFASFDELIAFLEGQTGSRNFSREPEGRTDEVLSIHSSQDTQ